MSRCIVWPGNEDDSVVAADQSLHLGLKRAACRPHQQQPVFGLYRLQSLRQLFLQSFRIGLNKYELYIYMSVINKRERDVLFNDALKTFYLRLYGVGEREMFYLTMYSTHFYLRLYGVRHMVKDHSDSEKGNPLPPHRLLLSINSKGSFICTIPQTG